MLWIFVDPLLFLMYMLEAPNTYSSLKYYCLFLHILFCFLALEQYPLNSNGAGQEMLLGKMIGSVPKP